MLMTEKMLTLAELCRELSVSVATGRNWIKLGKLVPTAVQGRKQMFSRDYADELKKSMLTGENEALKSRRNKKYVSGNGVYSAYVSSDSPNNTAVSRVLGILEEMSAVPDDEMIAALTAECALQLILMKQGAAPCSGALGGYLSGTICIGEYAPIVDDILGGNAPRGIIERFPELFGVEYSYVPREDTVGLLYISLKNIGDRKAGGAYYTPTAVVEKLCGRLFSSGVRGTVLDPCCGTGNFLLQLPDDTDVSNIYGNDTDSFGVRLTRLNIALRYGKCDMDFLRSHITEEDYLSGSFGGSWDYIIGNPPWGFDFSAEQKDQLRRRYTTAAGSAVESFDVFIEKSAECLGKGGKLSFVLPEALLNVRSHSAVRSVIMKEFRMEYLEYLGNAFDGVHCPCIILQTEKDATVFDGTGLTVNDGTREFGISRPRRVTPEIFSFTTDDREYGILCSIAGASDRVYLKDNADFALGIVTGNNKQYISCDKTEKNEMVLKGSDLCKYHFNDTDNYITFMPESFQQVAPEAYYRAPEKLLYRFICSQLVFAYDDRQTLSLNSCNILIPHIGGMNMKYIMAVLNSRVAQFFFSRSFRSVKVLRSHIEQIPIPAASEEQQKGIVRIADELISGSDDTARLYDKADRLIAELYGLSDEEYRAVADSLDEENLFL